MEENYDDETLTFWACRLGNIEIIIEVLKKHNFDKIFNEVCKYGHLEIVKELLNKEFDTSEGMIESIKHDHFEVFEELCNNSSFNGNNSSFIGSAICKNNLKILKILLKDTRFKFNNTFLVIAGIFHHYEVLKELLKDSRLKINKVEEMLTKKLKISDFTFDITDSPENIQTELMNYTSKKFLLYFNEEIEYLITN